MSKLEQKWWFRFPILMLALMCTHLIMHAAGLVPSMQLANLLIVILCVLSLSKIFSFILWILILFINPQLEKKLNQ
jgi:uncharacterized membrane protein